MSVFQALAQMGWLDYWRFWQAYHRYSVEGMSNLDGERPMLITGYHGRPLALDMCMFTAAFYERYGYLPHGFVHRGLESFPLLKAYTDALGFVTRDSRKLEAAVRRGEHLVTTPGGGQEGCRSFRQRYRVAWQGQYGFVRLAAKYALPIVPVAAAGADDTYFGLNDAEALGRRLGVPRRWAYNLWVGFGPLGLYPMSPPFPVKITQFVGEPFDPWAGVAEEAPSQSRVEDVHAEVVRRLQALLDHALDVTRRDRSDDI